MSFIDLQTPAPRQRSVTVLRPLLVEIKSNQHRRTHGHLLPLQPWLPSLRRPSRPFLLHREGTNNFIVPVLMP